MIYFRYLLLILFSVCFQTKAQSYKPADNKSSITFTVKNFGINVDGTFSHLDGIIMFDPLTLKNSHFDVSVKSETLDTGIGLRDKHLKKKDYLDAAQYSQIRFKSTEITSGEKSGDYLVTGNLTIKEVTREIQFPFTAEVTEDEISLAGSFMINRRDYNVGGKSISMSDIVDVAIRVFASKASNVATDIK